MTWGRYYWPVMLIITSALFLVPEIYALFTNFKNTLSDYARYELNITSPTEPFTAHGAAWILTLGAWLVVTFWLTFHIWFERFG
jgi:hypothetical protein